MSAGMSGKKKISTNLYDAEQFFLAETTSSANEDTFTFMSIGYVGGVGLVMCLREYIWLNFVTENTVFLLQISIEGKLTACF